MPTARQAVNSANQQSREGVRKSWDQMPLLKFSVHGSWEVERKNLPFGQHACDHATLATKLFVRVQIKHKLTESLCAQGGIVKMRQRKRTTVLS